MLFNVTALLEIFALGMTFWMAFYLLARGHSSAVTRRAILVLLLLSFYFLSAYGGLYQEAIGATGLREVILVVALGIWSSLTFRMISPRLRERLRWLNLGLLALSAVTAIMMLETSSVFRRVPVSPLYVARLTPGPISGLYVTTLLLLCFGVMYNLLSGARIGLSRPGKYFMIASVLIVSGVAYGSLAYASANPLPRFVVDLLILGVVVLLGRSVARHQALVERRMTLQDFSASGVAILCIALLYVFLALRWGLSLAMLSGLLVIVILTHSAYDLVREFLEQLQVRRESSLRHHLRELERAIYDQETLQRRLQTGLNLLCQSLQSTGGFIALRRSPQEQYTVVAQRRSLPQGTHIDPALVACEDVIAVSLEELPGIAWIAPAFEAHEQIALIGLRPPKARIDYSAGHLDLLVEFSDQVGTIVALSNRQPRQTSQIQDLIAESQADASRLRLSADEMLSAAATNLDPEFVKMIEEGLRHLSDYDALGKSRLADWTEIPGGSHIERGKKLNVLLKDSIEALRPGAEKPSGTLPREWYNYLVLHDAYVGDKPNREIMNRLYISEGTFNRTRRTAVRGLARVLLEARTPAFKARVPDRISSRPPQIQ